MTSYVIYINNMCHFIFKTVTFIINCVSSYDILCHLYKSYVSFLYLKFEKTVLLKFINCVILYIFYDTIFVNPTIKII